MRFALTAIIGSMALLTACGSSGVLLSKPAAVPAGIDLSGNWLLDNNSGTTQRAARELLVYVFLETGKSIKITQTPGGLFVSFDRSVVEEYRFGENREVSVGAITATRASGWEGEAYVVETLDDDGAKLVDTYRLLDDGQRLQRTIVIWHRNQKKLALEQDFDRI